MNIKQQCNTINVPGLCRIWTIPMSDVTLPAEVEAKLSIAQPIITSSSLGILEGLYDTLSFSSSRSQDGNGGYHMLTVEGEFPTVDPTIIDALEKMVQVKHLVVFRDNMEQLRFIVNARFTYGTDSSTIRGTQGVPFSFSVQSTKQHYFYTSTYTEAPDGTFSF